jgi:hypothetical protein
MGKNGASEVYRACDIQSTAQANDLVALAVHFVGDKVGRHVAEAVGDVVEERYGCCFPVSVMRCQVLWETATHFSNPSSSSHPHNAPSHSQSAERALFLPCAPLEAVVSSQAHGVPALC